MARRPRLKETTMNDEQSRKIIEDAQGYDGAREDTLWSLLSDFYSRRMAATAVFVWANAIMAIALSIFSAVMFFESDATRPQIMYAVLFLFGTQWGMMMKVFAWQMIHRNSIKREIKRLELRLADLAEALPEGAD
jgi:hypothetical protein